MPRQSLRKNRVKVWNSLPWKPIDVSQENLGEFGDTVFFGLEEVDGTEYNQSSTVSAPVENQEDEIDHVGDEIEQPQKSKKEKKERKKKPKKSSTEPKPSTSIPPEFPPNNSNSLWNSSLPLHNLVVTSLEKLNFHSPTPIQVVSIPLILSGNCDVVGSAETGSGKTLAFGLPIIHSLLNDWENLDNFKIRNPYALILAPTRELAVQISTVLSDVCQHFTSRKVQIVNIIGGMSEHKQRRLLSNPMKPAHILVATPGRFCDLLGDPEMVVLQNLSRLRYLVIDEADRMVEDGHFPELFKIFNQIRQHEKLSAEGKDPMQESQRAHLGANFEESEMRMNEMINETTLSEQDEGDDDFIDEDVEVDFKFDDMPSEEAILAARSSDFINSDAMEPQNRISFMPYLPNQRQTLLFSATAMGLGKESESRSRKSMKIEASLANKKKIAYLKGLGIPDHLRQLLETVGVQESTMVAIPTAPAGSVPVPIKSDSKKRKFEEDNPDALDSISPVAIPSGLKQYEVRSPAEEKDIISYYFLLKYPGRTLIFVNSIKTARRLDGLLRALGLNCRTIHAQLQQKQRLKALETFRSTPIGVLVATDVAARGLDLPKIQYVLHYDIARSPQVYVHRSGRTARAGTQGTSLSIVTPEDGTHHEDICHSLHLPSFPVMRLDLSSAPILTERVKLAKKIFTQSFISTQTSKQVSWLEQTAKEADFVVDEEMYAEIEDDLVGKGKKANKKAPINGSSNKKSLEQDRLKLKFLLSQPWQESYQNNPQAASGRRNKRALVVFAK